MKSYVINLNRRSDRLKIFYDSLPKDWPYEQPVVYKAIAGKLCNHPSWWNQGGGAWGCYKSHMNIIEQELNNDIKEDILIFEDDAIFCENFVSKMQKFLSLVPKDADQIYLGGQHLKPPIDNGEIYLANNINRTHAYIVTKKGLLVLYRWLNETKDWANKCHIDHHYGRAHRDKKIIAYTPKEWLVGQRADTQSDVSWKPVVERWWQKPNNSVNTAPMISKAPDNLQDKNIFVCVLGLHRSGSSCTAMILHKLGVHMGDNLGGYESKNGGGGEAQRLAHICEQAARFPSTQFNIGKDIIQKKLTGWINERTLKAKRLNTIAGGKYPHLCAMGDILLNILGDRLRIIHCDRSLEDSIDSLKRRSKLCQGWLAISDEEAENVQKWLWESKKEFLSRMNTQYIYNLSHKELMTNPQYEVDNIIKFLNIDVTPEQRTSAINHVKLSN